MTLPKRISIAYTRTLLNAALNGSLDNVEFITDPIFDFKIPKSCKDIPERILNPAEAWPSEAAYLAKYRQLGLRFINNFRKYEADCPQEITRAGPKLNTTRLEKVMTRHGV